MSTTPETTQIQLITDTLRRNFNTNIKDTATDLIFTSISLKHVMGHATTFQVKMIEKIAEESIQNRLNLYEQSEKLGTDSNSNKWEGTLSKHVEGWEIKEQYLIDNLRKITGIMDL